MPFYAPHSNYDANQSQSVPVNPSENENCYYAPVSATSEALTHQYPAYEAYYPAGSPVYGCTAAQPGILDYSYGLQLESFQLDAQAPPACVDQNLFFKTQSAVPDEIYGNSCDALLADDAMDLQPSASIQNLSTTYEDELSLQDVVSSFPRTLSANLPCDVNNASTSTHHYQTAATATKMRLILRPNEIRRRRADRRKAKVLEISSTLSFQATDPDTITSHEKKRLYVGGLEEYVVWMEGQIRLLGKQPKKMQKLPNYKGISSRSLRTMLTHFQCEAEKLHKELKSKEQNFLELESQVRRLIERSDNATSLRKDSLMTGESISFDCKWF